MLQFCVIYAQTHHIQKSTNLKNSIQPIEKEFTSSVTTDVISRSTEYAHSYPQKMWITCRCRVVFCEKTRHPEHREGSPPPSSELRYLEILRYALDDG